MNDEIHLPRPLIKNIAFFGDANIKETDPVFVNAFEIAKDLAKEGFTIVNGGGPGVMLASTKGAEEVSGETLTVTFFPENAPGFEGRYVGNVPDTEIVTDNYIERMFKLMEHADLYIIFKGGSGTISEFGTAWVLAKLYYGHHKPFILFGEFWKKIIKVFKENMNIDKYEMDAFRIVTKKENITSTIKELEAILASHDHTKCKVCSEKAYMT